MKNKPWANPYFEKRGEQDQSRSIGGEHKQKDKQANRQTNKQTNRQKLIARFIEITDILSLKHVKKIIFTFHLNLH